MKKYLPLLVKAMGTVVAWIRSRWWKHVPTYDRHSDDKRLPSGPQIGPSQHDSQDPKDRAQNVETSSRSTQSDSSDRESEQPRPEQPDCHPLPPAPLTPSPGLILETENAPVLSPAPDAESEQPIAGGPNNADADDTSAAMAATDATTSVDSGEDLPATDPNDSVAVVPTEPTSAEAETDSDNEHDPPPRLNDPVEPSGTEASIEKVGEGTQPDGSDPSTQREISPRKKREGVQPGKRGGRPHGPSSAPAGQGGRQITQRKAKPAVICWKRDREWILAVELPEDIPDITVVQDNRNLKRDEHETRCWRLAQLRGEVIVGASGAEEDNSTTIDLSDNNFLIFKLSGGGLDCGRRVRRSSNGSFLAIVPETWKRDEEKAGPPPATPEYVCIEGYRAHFFDSAGIIAFRGPADTSVTMGPEKSRFQLVGERLIDASEDLGPLFGGSPPQIHTTTEDAWAEVGTIVVGEEGPGSGRWREVFPPDPKDGKQTLPDAIAAKKAGWYFLRLYDAQDELLESFAFRFIEGLKGFSILQPSAFPPASGHAEVTVEFLLDVGWNVTPACPSAKEVNIEDTGGRTVLMIPPLPACDRSLWLVGADGTPQVKVSVLVERIWWAVCEESATPSQWRDEPVSLCRDDFVAISVKAIWLRLPKLRWSDTVLAGFRPATRRPYRAMVAENTISIPLRDFGDTDEVADTTQEHDLKIWIMRNEGPCEGVIATIPANLTPGNFQGDFSIEDISAPRLAGSLTALRRGTSGPLRFLFKEVRREYRRPHCRATGHKLPNDEFVKKTLCVIAVALRTQNVLPLLSSRFEKRAHFAAREFPDIMRQMWNRYRELQ